MAYPFAPGVPGPVRRRAIRSGGGDARRETAGQGGSSGAGAQARPDRRGLKFEALEPRLLLSADPFTAALAADNADGYTLTVDTETANATTTKYLRLTNNADSSLVAEKEVDADTTSATITGSDDHDLLILDLGTEAITVTFDGGAGVDDFAVAGDGSSSGTVFDITSAGPDGAAGTLAHDGLTHSFSNVEGLNDFTGTADRTIRNSSGDALTMVATDNGEGSAALGTLDGPAQAAVESFGATAIGFGLAEAPAGTLTFDGSAAAEAAVLNGLDDIGGVNALLAGGSDQLILANSFFDEVTHQLQGPGAGQIALTESGGATRTVTYAGTGTVGDFTNATLRGFVDQTGAATGYRLSDDAAASDRVSELSSPGGQFADTRFFNPNIQLRIDGGAGGDALTYVGLDQVGFADPARVADAALVAFDGGSGSNTLIRDNAGAASWVIDGPDADACRTSRSRVSAI
jgi:hypothetical protein